MTLRSIIQRTRHIDGFNASYSASIISYDFVKVITPNQIANEPFRHIIISLT